MYSQSLVTFKQLGEKRRSSFPLSALGDIKMTEGKTEEAEEFYNESLEIKRQFSDKRGISNVLNNLGLLYFENGNSLNAKASYIEAITLRHELNETKGIFGITHRAFSLFDSKEREEHYSKISSLINESTELNHLSLFANIDLLQYCLSNRKVKKTIVKEKINMIKIQKEKSSLKDLDDLPIEAFYQATLKLTEIGEPKMAKIVADDALKMIGEKKSIRKETFQEIAKSVAPKIY